MAILRWLLGSLVAPFFDALAGILRDRQANADARARGQAEQKAVDQAAAVAAGKIVQGAQAEPRGRDVTQGSLDRGSF